MGLFSWVKKHAEDIVDPIGAVAVSGLTLNTGTDTVDRAAFNTALTGLGTEVNAIKDVLNNLILRLESAEILASS